MSNDINSRAVTVSVKIYECLLAAYPGAFRREFGPAMKQLFRDQCRDGWSEAGGWGLTGVWLRVLPDWAKTSFVEHLSNLHRRESLFMKTVRAIRGDPRLRSAFLRVFGTGFTCAIVCAVLLAAWSPRVYSSRVLIEAHNDTSKASPNEPSAAQHSGDADPYFLTTQSKIIVSYHILTNVIAKLNLDQKLAEQLGKPRWTMDETYLHLSKMIHVENTRMTSLLEITVNNPDPALAANIANSIAESYRNSRLEQWKQIHLGGIYAFETNLAAMGQLLQEKQEELDKLRAVLGVTGTNTQPSNSTADYGKMLQVWTEEAVRAKADFLEYSNILFQTSQIPWDELGAQLSVSDNEIESILSGVRVRVSQDLNYLQIIELNEAAIRADKDKHDEALRPYYQLTDEVENLRYENRESERYLNQAIADVGQPDVGMAIVRDPARAGRKPISPNLWTFLTWLLEGALLAVLAGGAAALVATIQRAYRRQGAN
jgi:hypothetical protein